MLSRYAALIETCRYEIGTNREAFPTVFGIVRDLDFRIRFPEGFPYTGLHEDSQSGLSCERTKGVTALNPGGLR